MNTSAAQNTTSSAQAPNPKQLRDTLIELGSSWAVFGLKIGKMAISQTAEALGKTAATLDSLADAMQKRVDEAAACPPAEAQTPAPEAKDEAASN
ncbi:MAG: hypothetical protein U0441_26365 [Polyangiaceae bacterium]